MLPGLNDQLGRVKVGSSSLPIAVGLFGMMYTVLARVRYNELHKVTTDRPLVLSSLLLSPFRNAAQKCAREHGLAAREWDGVLQAHGFPVLREGNIRAFLAT